MEPACLNPGRCPELNARWPSGVGLQAATAEQALREHFSLQLPEAEYLCGLGSRVSRGLGLGLHP